MKRFLTLLMALLMLMPCVAAYAVDGVSPAPGGFDACNHHWQIHYEKTPTCYEDGWGYYKCSKCGAIKDYFDRGPLGHDYGPWEVTVPPTCTQPGKQETKCRRCGLPWYKEIDPLGHDMGEWHLVKIPTPEAPGLEQRDCIRADLTETREIPWTPTQDEMTVTKAEITAPKDPNGYGVGETIGYCITVTNTGTREIRNVEVYDPLNDGTGYLGSAILEPGDSAQFFFDHTVTETDSLCAVVVNQAYAYYETDTVTIVDSNVVIVPVLPHESMPTVEKIEVTVPALGYYEEQEEIGYIIRVSNSTQDRFTDLYVNDWLNAEAPVFLGKIDALNPGDVYEFSYSHVVNLSDVERTYVENYATVSYVYEVLRGTLKRGAVSSNVVVSPTGEIVIPPIRRDPFGHGGPRPCTLTLEDLCAETAMYDQYICVEHQPYAARAEAAAAPADARAAWEEGLSAMYAKAYATAGYSEVRAALQSEQDAFYAYIEAYETTMKDAGADSSAVDETICRLVKRQCTDLCYIVHTAPETRADSYVGVASVMRADAAEVCGMEMFYTSDSDELYMQNLCEAHSKAQAAVLKLLGEARDSQHTLNVWQQAARIWQVELKKQAAADSAAFDVWFRSHSALLAQCYDADAAAEASSRVIMNRVMELGK